MDFFEAIDEALHKNDLETFKNVIHNIGCLGSKRNDYGDTVLHKAVTTNCKLIINYLIEKNLINLELKNNRGETPLHTAIKSYREDSAILLINSNADLESKTNRKETPLHFAVERQTMRIIDALLHQNVDLESKNKYAETALHFATKLGYFDIVKHLCQKNADVNCRNSNGDTLLHTAVSIRNLDLIAHYKSKGLKFDCVNNNGETVMHIAAKRRHFVSTSQYRFYIECKTKFLNFFKSNPQISYDCKTKQGFTPLDIAIYYENWFIVDFILAENGKYFGDSTNSKEIQLLLAVYKDDLDTINDLENKEANLKYRNIHGETPFSIAVKFGCLKTLNYFIDKGLNLQLLCNHQGISPLDRAILLTRLDVINILLNTTVSLKNDKFSSELLKLAIERDCLNLVKKIEEKNLSLECGANFSKFWPILIAADNCKWDIVKYLADKHDNFKCNTGTCLRKALLTACQKGNLEVVKYLFEKSKIFEFENCYNDHLIQAAKFGHKSVVRFLFNSKIDLEGVDQNGDTALHAAVPNNHFNIVEYLVQKNVNLESQDRNGDTPIIKAATNWCYDIVKYLADHANLEATDREGNTCLHIAVRRKELSLVKFLAEKHSNLECTNNKGLTPLHIAASYDYLAIVKYLHEKKANLNCINKNGETPVYLACLCKSFNVVNYLNDQNVYINCTDGCNAFNEVFSELYSLINRKIDYKYMRNILMSQAANYVEDLFDGIVKSFCRAPSVFISQIEEEILKNNKSLICSIRNIKGVHLVNNPVKLECGHLICMSCVMEKYRENRFNTLFCCLKQVKAISYHDIFKHKSNELILNENIVSTAHSYLTTLTSCSNVVNNEKSSYEYKLKFIEDSIDIRIRSIKSEVNKLQKHLFTRIDSIKLNCLISTKSERSSLNHVSNLEKMFCLQKIKIKTNIPKKKDIGFLYLLSPTYVRNGPIQNNLNSVYYTALDKNVCKIILKRINFMKDLSFLMRSVSSTSDLYDLRQQLNSLHVKIDLERKLITNSSKIDSVILKKGDSSICRIKNVKGVHLLNNPIKLKCGHSICSSCILEEKRQNCVSNLYCCMQQIPDISDKQILMDYSDKSFFKKDIVNSYLITLQLCSNVQINEEPSYKERINLIDKSILTHFENLKLKFDDLKNNIFRVIDRIKQSSRIKLKKKKSSLNNILSMEKLCTLANVEKIFYVPKQNDSKYIRLLNSILNGFKGLEIFFLQQQSEATKNDREELLYSSFIKNILCSMMFNEDGFNENFTFLLQSSHAERRDIREIFNCLVNLYTDRNIDENDFNMNQYLNEIEIKLVKYCSNDKSQMTDIIQNLRFIYQSMKNDLFI